MLAAPQGVTLSSNVAMVNRHAKLAPTGSINMGASPLRNLASLSYHPLYLFVFVELTVISQTVTNQPPPLLMSVGLMAVGLMEVGVIAVGMVTVGIVAAG